MRSHKWVAVGVAAFLGTAAVAAVVRSAGADGEGARSVLVPITPCRLIDTRAGADNVGSRSAPIGAGEAVTFQVTGTNGNCAIPASATGIAANATAVNPTAPSYVTIYPADAVPRPTASNLNVVAGASPTPNQVTVGLSATGAISIYNNGGTVDIIIDIVGYYTAESTGSATPTPHTHDDRYYTEAESDARFSQKIDDDALHAKQKYISIDVTGTYGPDNTVEGIKGSVGLIFKDNDPGISVISFTAPPDLTPNTNMTLQMTYVIQQANCTIKIEPNSIFVSRPGETAPTVPDAPAPVPGFVVVGANPRPAPSPVGTVAVMNFTLGRPLNGAGLNPGDAVSLTFVRGADTCTQDLLVAGIQVLYS